MLDDHVFTNVLHSWTTRLAADPRLEVVAYMGEDLLTRGADLPQLEDAALRVAAAHRLTGWPVTFDALPPAVRTGEHPGAYLVIHVAALRLVQLGAYAPLAPLARAAAAVLPADPLLPLLAAGGDLVTARSAAAAASADAALHGLLTGDPQPRRARLALAAYAMATHLPEAGTRILDLVTELVRADAADPQVRYFAAVALRHQRRFDDALDTIDAALAALAVGGLPPGELEAAAEQFLDERELIRLHAEVHTVRS